jgi:hypothetical protein
LDGWDVLVGREERKEGVVLDSGCFILFHVFYCWIVLAFLFNVFLLSWEICRGAGGITSFPEVSGVIIF